MWGHLDQVGIAYDLLIPGALTPDLSIMMALNYALGG